MKIAHFSDFHICEEFGGESLVNEILEAIEDAIARGADHFVFTGDLVDYANLKDFTPVRKKLATFGFSTSEHITIIPGNHDVMPISKNQWIDTRSAKETVREFYKLAKRFAKGAAKVWSNDTFPFVKKLSNRVILVGIDSVHYTKWGRLKPSHGKVSEQTMIEVEKLLQEKPYSNANTKILALHHPPTNLHDSFITNDWRLENWEDVRDFCERVGFDFILAGHWHNPSSKNRVQKLGKGKLVISACDVSAERAIVRYHLIDIPTRGANKLKRYSWGE